MISSIRPKQSISWTFVNDAMAISAKEMPKNHTDKEIYFSHANDGVLVPVIYQSPRFRSRRVSDLKVPNVSFHAKVCDLILLFFLQSYVT